jgi:hypothetical protein
MAKVLVLIRCGVDFEPPFGFEMVSDITLFRSYYGEIDEAAKKAHHFHHFDGGKWSGIFDFFETYPELINDYDHFWFPDDDILTNEQVATEFIKIALDKGFALCQPALTTNSYWAHLITIVNPNFIYRCTNFVELMMPLMNKALLLKLLPIFKGRHAAMGLDFFWHQLTEASHRDVAIIDATPMQHSRPRQQLLKSAMKERNLDIDKERSETFRLFQIKRQMPFVLSGGLTNGETLQCRSWRLFVELLSGLRQVAPLVHRPIVRPIHYVKTALYQLFSSTRKASFSKISYQQLIE